MLMVEVPVDELEVEDPLFEDCILENIVGAVVGGVEGRFGKLR